METTCVGQFPCFMDELTFIKQYMKYMEIGGHTYHLGDVLYAWEEYKNFPEKYEYLARAS